MKIRTRVGLSRRRQAQLARAMEIALLLMIGVGIERGSTGIVVNAGVGFAVTQLVPLLERNYNVPMDPALTLWITSAVFLHAVGTVGVPGSELNFYRTVWWYDHLTHALSASVVAGVGYAAVRALDAHSAAVHFPRRFTFVFVLLFVLAFGVFWEVIEFAIGLFAAATGSDAVLTQYGLDDSMRDLLFNTLGAVVAATWGTAHLNDVSGALAALLDDRND